MTEVLKFMGEHPVLTFFLVAIVSTVVGQAVHTIFLVLPNRIMRHRTLRMHGYPPPHCDADGDFKEKKR